MNYLSLISKSYFQKNKFELMCMCAENTFPLQNYAMINLVLRSQRTE